jgi:hypothetical protein
MLWRSSRARGRLPKDLGEPQAGGVGRNSTKGSGFLGQEAPPIQPPRMIRLRSLITTTEDSREMARRAFCGSRWRTSRQKRFHQTDGLVADVDPVLGRRSSTLSRDTGSDITVIRRMISR